MTALEHRRWGRNAIKGGAWPAALQPNGAIVARRERQSAKGRETRRAAPSPVEACGLGRLETTIASGAGDGLDAAIVRLVADFERLELEEFGLGLLMGGFSLFKLARQFCN